MNRSEPSWAMWPALPLLALLALPVLALVLSSSPSSVLDGIVDPRFAPALWLSLWTSGVSLTAILAAGTPLAWWLATTSSPRRRMVELLVDVPIVLPPAVVGISLLLTFGRTGLLGPLGLQIAFTSAAVILAQITVAAPFYVQGAAAAFRRVDPDLMLVARTLGQSPGGAFFRVAVPIALPGLISASALALGRALGEFGATLLFAGNRMGVTQTLPLAIYSTLESDVQAATTLALVLAALSLLLLLLLRLTPVTPSGGTR